MCLLIAGTTDAGWLAATAGLCHNADRLLQQQHAVGPSGKVLPTDIEAMVRGWLAQEPLILVTDHDQIVRAVLRHSSPNAEDDTEADEVIKAADRLVNYDLDAMLRHAQSYPELPCFDPTHFVRVPGENYRNLKTILGSLLITREEWLEEGGRFGTRLPKARALMQKRMRAFCFFIDILQAQLDEEGVTFAEL